ncbi:SIS domain-containing protein [Candidatus Peregrinibacteria bacterium]|nr:SIS domain-containing protein [Candidatus Peregrinibacteria bacterium]
MEPNYFLTYLNESIRILQGIDVNELDKMVAIYKCLRKNNGRLFILGVGGSCANASHAVNDFRKLVGIETYTPTDNASELTARTNDEGWHTVFVEWLKISHLNSNDVLLILSVGGGNKEKNISANIVEALVYAKTVGAKITGIVSRDGGHTKQVADACILIPPFEPHITPHAEEMQGVVWHAIVNHPELSLARKNLPLKIEIQILNRPEPSKK